MDQAKLNAVAIATSWIIAIAFLSIRVHTKIAWRTKRTHCEYEVYGKLRIVAHARMSVYVQYVHNLGVHGRFYGLDLKMETVVLETRQCRTLDIDEVNDCRFEV